MLRILFITALFAVSSALQAQPPGPPPAQDPEQHFSRLALLLDLSAEQQPQVREILVAAHAERERLDQQSREAHEALREVTDNALAAVLDGEQLARWRALSAERRPPPPREGPPPRR